MMAWSLVDEFYSFENCESKIPFYGENNFFVVYPHISYLKLPIDSIRPSDTIVHEERNCIVAQISIPIVAWKLL